MGILTIAASAAAACLSPTVHDGDSIRCGAEKVRIADIDAPEVAGSPSCQRQRRKPWAWCDFELGAKARDALRGLIARGHRVTIVRTGVDRYGRTLALVSVDGVDAGEWLISQGLARRWR